MCTQCETNEKKFDQLMAVIKENKKKPGPLMPTLHKAQKIFGCVPLEVQKIISHELNEQLAKIYGVVTFYAQFSLEPKGEYVVGVCLGTACYVKGAQKILDRVSKEIGIGVGETSEDGKFTLEATRCIGACGLAPVFTVNEDVYGNVSEEETSAAIKKYME